MCSFRTQPTRAVAENDARVPGDILAKSFKWIYAKFCLCRVCPGVARRRALRARRRARTEESDYQVSAALQNIGLKTILSEMQC